MNIAKKLARTVVFPTLAAIGAERILTHLSSNKKLILVYHGVVDKPQHNISVGPIDTVQFEKQLQYLRTNFDLVSQDEIFAMYRSNHIPKRNTIAITFDDGYENNYTTALPILEKYKVPATMYIISQCIDDDLKLTWYDYIDLIKSELDLNKISSLNPSKSATLRVSTINDLKKLIKGLTINERESLFAEINSQINLSQILNRYGREHWKLMNRNQVKAISKTGLIEIGAHTHNHPNLGLIPIENATKEMKESKNKIEDLIQQEVRSIAFPDGSYTQAVKESALEIGYSNLLAVDPILNTDKNDSSLLPRYCISSTTTFESNIFNINKAFGYYGF